MKKLIIIALLFLMALISKAAEYPESVGLTGSFRGWADDISIPMSDIPGVYEISVPINGEFKFRLNNSWEINYGVKDIIVENEYGGTAHININGANFRIDGPQRMCHLVLNLNNNTFRWEDASYVPEVVLCKTSIDGEWKNLTKVAGSSFTYRKLLDTSEKSDLDLYLKVSSCDREYYLSATNKGTLQRKHLVDEGDFIQCNEETQVVPFHIKADSERPVEIYLNLALQKLYSKLDAENKFSISNMRLQDLNEYYIDMHNFNIVNKGLDEYILYPTDGYPLTFVGFCYLPANPKFRIMTDNIDDGGCFISPRGNGEVNGNDVRLTASTSINGERYWNLHNWPAGLTKITVTDWDVTFERINNDDEFTDWESLGFVDVNVSTSDTQSDFERLSTFIKNSYSSHNKEVTVNTVSHILRRHYKNDNARSQIMLYDFLGLANPIFDIDNDIYIGSTTENLSIPIPLSSEPTGYGTQYYQFSSPSIAYQPTNNNLQMNFSLLVDDRQGYNFYLSYIGNKNEVDDGFTLTTSGGGLKSSDNSISCLSSLTGDVGYLKYVYVYTEEEYIGYKDVMRKIVKDASYAISTHDKILVNFDKGAGKYRLYVLAFNYKNEYLGIYHIHTLESNMRPDGDWESIGEAIWHHPWKTDWWSQNSNVNIVDEDLQWKVQVEKLKDPLKTAYRIVNPYKSGTSFYNKVKEYYEGQGYYFDSDTQWVDESDTYWFVFDSTDLANVKIYPRLNGAVYDHVMNRWFNKANGRGSWDDKTLTITLPTRYYPNSYVIEFDGDSEIGAIVEDTSIEPEYFNIQGMKISNPSNGIFIRRIGDKIDKIVR